jgi:hypothetical protein
MLVKIEPVREELGERRRSRRFAKPLKKRQLVNRLGKGAKNSSPTLNVDEKTGVGAKPLG